MKLKVKFDVIQNIERQIKLASEEELRAYRENKEEYNKKFIERFKEALKNKINYDDYCWIENLEVKYEI